MVELKLQVEVCEKCPELIRSRTQYDWGKPTFGYGNLNSVVFIGEAPGKYGCGRTGKPFCGDRSGRLYMALLEKLGWGYEGVYTTNIVKCCPLDNRTPNRKEIRNCRWWLESELRILHPRIIVAMGRTAANWFGIRERLSMARCKRYKWKGAELHVTWHPAYILRTGNIHLETYEFQFRFIKERELKLNGKIDNS